jgi:hypothetical protein
MPSFDYLELPVVGARSLAWQGDVLVDWLNCTSVYELNGNTTSGGIHYGYRFDSVVQSPSGDYTVLYERRGTKGVVLRGQEVLREIDRSYYQADLYDYPIALFDLPDGRAAVAHCPARYNQLEIDLLETGQRLTARTEGQVKPVDVFHSGLAVGGAGAGAGAWLMSAGWIWHPCYEVTFYSLEDALREPASLDQDSGAITNVAEIASAVFLDADRVAVASDPDAEDLVDPDYPDARLRPGMIGVYRPGLEDWETLAAITEPMGRLLAVDAQHVLSLFTHPKLVHLPTGRIVERWPQISSGNWTGCISQPAESEPPIAWDPRERRLAVASSEKIQILSLSDRPSAPPDAATP